MEAHVTYACVYSLLLQGRKHTEVLEGNDDADAWTIYTVNRVRVLPIRFGGVRGGVGIGI